MPKRSSERRRRNADSAPTTAVRVGAVVKPEPPARLHPIALALYESLAESGQSDYFEPSDWAAASYLAVAMTKSLRGRKFSAPLFAAIWSAFDDLGVTEPARRRARIEVERLEAEEDEKPAHVTALDEYKQRLKA